VNVFLSLVHIARQVMEAGSARGWSESGVSTGKFGEWGYGAARWFGERWGVGWLVAEEQGD